MPVKRRPNLAETDQGSYSKEERLEEFLVKVHVTMVMRVIMMKIMNSNSYQRVFINSCYKTVSAILLQNYLTIMPSTGTIMEYFQSLKMSATVLETRTNMFQKGTTPFNRSTRAWSFFMLLLHKVYILNQSGNQFSSYRLCLENFIFAKQKQILSKQQILF